MGREHADGKEKKKGEIFRVAGPVVTAVGLTPRMYDVVFVGQENLMGEVIGLSREKTIIQVYEDTSGIRPGEEVVDTGNPLMVELGPGLLASIYDGIQRPLTVLKDKMGDYIKRGLSAPGIEREKKWEFTPLAEEGKRVKGGDILGSVMEAQIEHFVMVPPGAEGNIERMRPGSYGVEEAICTLEGGRTLSMMQRWPVRVSRPYIDKLLPDIPLITGQRVLDTFFPLAKGGTAAIPGGFGTGKTVTQHQLSKWSDSKIVVYVGCGERGNEMTEVLTEFPKLEDPQTGAPLMQRTVLIANTSNMPVAAREASVYTGITIAEYFRDMGYHVSLMADSTSRWAEAMREISSRLEEMPGEEGYPAYLSARLSDFYERAGRITALCGREGSVSIIGAVSPQGGDFSEPVTQGTLRIVKVFWALDTKLRERRHFPAINWLTSYSLYTPILEKFFRTNVSDDFPRLRAWAMEVLQKEAELQEIVQLVGSDALPEEQRLLLEIARMLREIFLQQDAYHRVDTYSSIGRQYELLRAIKKFSDTASRSITLGVEVRDIAELKSKVLLGKVRFEENFERELERIVKLMEEEFRQMEASA